jgi:hypothetical protein
VVFPTATREATASGTGAVAAQLARILTALSGGASRRWSCQAWLLLLVRSSSADAADDHWCAALAKQQRAGCG